MEVQPGGQITGGGEENQKGSRINCNKAKEVRQKIKAGPGPGKTDSSMNKKSQDSLGRGISNGETANKPYAASSRSRPRSAPGRPPDTAIPLPSGDGIGRPVRKSRGSLIPSPPQNKTGLSSKGESDCLPSARPRDHSGANRVSTSQPVHTGGDKTPRPAFARKPTSSPSHSQAKQSQATATACELDGSKDEIIGDLLLSSDSLLEVAFECGIAADKTLVTDVAVAAFSEGQKGRFSRSGSSRGPVHTRFSLTRGSELAADEDIAAAAGAAESKLARDEVGGETSEDVPCGKGTVFGTKVVAESSKVAAPGEAVESEVAHGEVAAEEFEIVLPGSDGGSELALSSSRASLLTLGKGSGKRESQSTGNHGGRGSKVLETSQTILQVDKH